MQKEKFKISADQTKGPMVEHVERAKRGIKSAMYELKDIKNCLGDSAKLPEEPDVQAPIKMEEEYGEDQSEGGSAT